MELLNATRMQAAYTMGTEPSAREHLVVAVKGTFAISDDGEPGSHRPHPSCSRRICVRAPVSKRSRLAPDARGEELDAQD
jgi:hypothetical protein